MNITKSIMVNPTRVVHHITLTAQESRIIMGAMGRASTSGAPERVQLKDGTEVVILIPAKPAEAVASHVPVDGSLIGDMF